MQFETELRKGVLVRRYKRFLADVILDTGDTVTAHVPNTGSMKSTNSPGSEVGLSHHPSPTRKLKWTLEIIRADNGALVGVNTMVPNRVVEEAIVKKKIPGLKRYRLLRREVPYGTNSRIDILLEGSGLLENGDPRHTYVEVKNVTYKRGEKALFPDAVTARGTKHLRELMKVVTEGHRAVIFFFVNRGDCKSMGPAWDIDPEYAKTLKGAAKRGVEVMAYHSVIDFEGVRIGGKVRKVLGR